MLMTVLKFLLTVLRRTVQTRPAPRIPPTVEVIEKEENWEKKTQPIDQVIQNSSEENHLFTQRWRVSHMGEELENKGQPTFVDLSQPPCRSLPSIQQSRNPLFPEEPAVLGDGQQLRTSEALVQRKDIMARIAELTLQNSAIKAHLNNIGSSGGEQGDGLRELSKQGNASEVPAVSTAETAWETVRPVLQPKGNKDLFLLMVSEGLLSVAECIALPLRLDKQTLMVARTRDRGHLSEGQRVRHFSFKICSGDEILLAKPCLLPVIAYP